MIDGSEKRNRQLAFELQNSHVCEKRSNKKEFICSTVLLTVFVLFASQLTAGLPFSMRTSSINKPIAFLPFSLTSPPSSSLWGTSRNYVGDGKENVKKAIGLMSKTTILHVHHAFLYISLLSLHNYDVKWSNSKFTRKRKRQGVRSNQNSLLLSIRANWENREKV